MVVNIYSEIFSQFLITGYTLFFIGLGTLIIYQKNLILALMGLELALLGISYLFLHFSLLTFSVYGQIVLFLLLALAGAESAIGLALIMLYYRLRANLSLQHITDLKF